MLVYVCCLLGLLYDYLGSYNVAFHVAGVPPIIGALLMFFIPRHKQVIIIHKAVSIFWSTRLSLEA